jgi:ribosomal-protein-serine acetyltransferase
MTMNQDKTPLTMNQNSHYCSSETIRVSDAITLEMVQQSIAGDLFDLIQRNQLRLSRFLAWPKKVESLEDTRDFIQTQSADHHRGVGKTYAIIIQGRDFGILSFNAIDSANQTTTIGYWIDGSLEGKGVVSATQEVNAGILVEDAAFKAATPSF